MRKNIRKYRRRRRLMRALCITLAAAVPYCGAAGVLAEESDSAPASSSVIQTPTSEETEASPDAGLSSGNLNHPAAVTHSDSPDSIAAAPGYANSDESAVADSDTSDPSAVAKSPVNSDIPTTTKIPDDSDGAAARSDTSDSTTVAKSPENSDISAADIPNNSDDTAATCPESTFSPASQSAHETSSGTILEILDSDSLSALDPVVIVQNTTENNDALLLRILQLQSVTARVRTADGETTLRLSVDWNVGYLDHPQIDVSVPGTYEEIGTIVFPDGYACADGVLRQLILPVHVVVPDSPVILTQADAWNGSDYACAVPTGSDLSDFVERHALPELWNCYAADGTLYQASVSWDIGSIDPATPGLFWITGTLTAPQHTAFAETLDVPQLRIPVSVQEPSRPELSYIFAARSFLCVPLAGLPGDPARIRILLAAENGAWQNLTGSGSCILLEDAIYLNQDLFTLQKTYRLQMEYEGGKTGILTFLFDETLEHFQYSGGDRDGGDSGSGRDDDRVQPAPELPETEQTETQQTDAQPAETQQTETSQTGTTDSPDAGSGSSSDHNGSAQANGNKSDTDTSASHQTNPAAAKSKAAGQRPAEHFTADYDLISGTRLLLTLETTGCAQFSKHGITVTIPKAALDTQQITREDFFRITILQMAADTFSFFFEKNGASVPTISGLQIMLPWSDTSADHLLLLDDARRIISIGSFDAASGIASFRTGQTGTFLIVPDDGTVSALSDLIDTCRIRILQQLSRYPLVHLLS